MKSIEINELTFAYAGSDELALDNISFDLEKGDFCVIIGKSGSGKSTLLRLLKKKIAPEGRMSGNIKFMGNSLEAISDREQAHLIGFVGQNPDNQIVTDKVWHELAFGLESLGYNNEAIRRKVAEMAEYFGISDWYNFDTEILSGGQKQLLNLAAVMVMQPEVLLLDEPTAQLDPVASKKFINTLNNLNKELGITIICVEHNLENVFSMANKCVVLEKGSLLMEDVPQKVASLLIEKENDLALGLPSAAKIYQRLNAKECAKEKSNTSITQSSEIPLSVNQGRRWVSEVLKGKTVTSKNSECKKGLNKSDIITAKNIWYEYEKNHGYILKGLDLSISQGTISAILGGNGAGKSTFLKLLTGIIKPTRGKLSVEKPVVMLPQNPMALFSEISVEEELAEVISDNKAWKELVEEMLDKLSLKEKRYLHPYDLSGGEQQKLAMGKLLLLKPDVLLLDEPTKGLDTFARNELGKWLLALKEQGVTIVIVSHDVEFCAEFADNCALLFDGAIANVDNSKNFFSGNMFFTTGINRIMKDIEEKCVTLEDVCQLIIS